MTASLRSVRLLVALCAGAAVALFLASAEAGQSLSNDELARIDFEQKLGARIDLNLEFRDDLGRVVRLSRYFHEQPVVLVLGYYECPMLCSLISNGLIQAMLEIKGSVGQEFQIVHVSIDPNESPSLAATKKQTYLRSYRRPGAELGWHLLTGDDPAIHQLTDQVGFHYAYDPEVGEYAHPSGLVLLTPDGTVARYFFGVSFPATELHRALVQTSNARVGSPVQQFLLLCFHYSPLRGKYGALIMGLVRAAGILILLWLAVTIVRVIRQDRRRQPILAASEDPRTTEPPDRSPPPERAQ